MYAIFQAKGKQFRADPEGTLRVPLLDAEPGDEVTFDEVLLGEREGRVVVGQPALQGASVLAEVIRHGKDDKIVVYKMKRRKGYRRKQGHRQGFTEILVREIELGSGKTAKPVAKAARPEAKKAGAKPKAKAEEATRETAKAAPKGQSKAPAEAKPSVEATIEITDAARALAEEHGIDLAGIEGSGKEGRILKSDIDKAIKEKEGK
jgi:large subunit ribosomal protein L21